ncbi:MOB kinase activator-like 1A [Cardamine amara subsp. amara]|uniref:MOB kinase activator-like 1A n=1 Tax=Cardamine amara subsp. amara TaxID=228776 RepID=A0ABD1A1N0_CARAN
MKSCIKITTLRAKKRKTSSFGSKVEELRTSTIASGNLREAVRLPPGEDIHEWLAINTVDFYNQINILYATLEEFCTPTTCPIMNAGSRYEFRWKDGITIEKPIVVSAPKYVEYLMDWIETQIDDETIFPQKPGAPFPPKFEDFVKQIFKRLFRVYAHIYCSHIQKVVRLGEDAHLYTCFKHIILFISEYQLVDKEELDPLKHLVEKILKP